MGKLIGRTILRYRDYIPEVFAFVLGIGAAWHLNWETSDLVWGLWLSSLVVGSLTILAFILSDHMISWSLWRYRKHSSPLDGIAVVGIFAGSLFILAFFSVHFGGFHAVHAAFLNESFPLADVSPDIFIAATQHFLPNYGACVIAMIIAERRHIIGTFFNSYKAAYLIRAAENRTAQLTLAKEARDRNAAHGSWARPYINVVRMHLLIFFFGGAAAAGINSWWVFVVVYLIYFFPWRILKKGTEQQTSSPGTPEQKPSELPVH